MSDPEKTDPAKTTESNNPLETDKSGEDEKADLAELQDEPEEAPGPSPESTIQSKEEEIQALNEKYLRVCADLDNFKKRTIKDRADQLRYANESLLKELLPVLDNMERAIEHMNATPELTQWVEGVELTLRQCLDVMKKFGVQPIKSLGEPFDPAVHQAVTFMETQDHADNAVAEELQKGYLYHNRVLRPSMVAVARNPSGEKTPTEDSAGEEDSPEP